jgi:hypothetical protein
VCTEGFNRVNAGRSLPALPLAAGAADAASSAAAARARSVLVGGATINEEGSIMADEKLFEDRGWRDIHYRPNNLFVWRNPDCPGLMIDAADTSGRKFVIFAGDPLRKVGRLTEFDDADAAITFCERVAPLADWPQAGDWSASPAGLDEQVHQIALDVAGGKKAPRG